MTRTLVVSQSGNSKTGRMAVTYRTADSCPTTCPLQTAGCYARGRIFGIPAKHGLEDNGNYAAVRALAHTLPDEGMIRANVSGDMLREDGTPDVDYMGALSALAADRPDVSVFGYSHAWRMLRPIMAPRVALNASCDTAAELETAAAAGWPTVVTDTGDPADTLIGSTIAGRKIVQCPAQTRPNVTCDSCRLCARPNRRSTVAFIVHGSGRGQATRAIRAERASCAS